MTTPFEPVIGEWYRMPEGTVFEVVAITEHDGTIDVQYADGTVGEYDTETWATLELVTAAPPDDSAIDDDIDGGDYRGLDDLEGAGEDWVQNRADDYD